jgi:hypothetical protein
MNSISFHSCNLACLWPQSDLWRRRADACRHVGADDGWFGLELPAEGMLHPAGFAARVLKVA